MHANITVTAISLAIDHNVQPVRYDKQYNPYLLATVRTPVRGKNGPVFTYRKAV